MYAVEFQTTIKNGMIEIPVEYQRHLRQSVRVILLAEDAAQTAKGFIDQLLAQPLQVKDFSPLTREEIYAR
ncbi:MAG: hypothetical protein KDE54_32255 [Caldilineaceae bacterium]|nr:hypothetical protein [Caldilineaceae bacterium]MCB0098476.1 hypothetical protein [Caldilineaceae bacterium]MCB0144311.1 hypothetical protein [Caldilineaceae bacterium]MCB9147126.1 hypothetical protein [Caldilineaceae bacterium]